MARMRLCGLSDPLPIPSTAGTVLRSTSSPWHRGQSLAGLMGEASRARAMAACRFLAYPLYLLLMAGVLRLIGAPRDEIVKWALKQAGRQRLPTWDARRGVCPARPQKASRMKRSDRAVA